MSEIVRRPNSLLSFFSDNEPTIVDAFLTAQDVKQSSKETYQRQLRQFLGYPGIRQISALIHPKQ